MVSIRILNVIVDFIINVFHRIKCAKRNVQAIKNIVALPANVVQQVTLQCHVDHTFPEVRQYPVSFLWKITRQIIIFLVFRSSKSHRFDLSCSINNFLHWFWFIINRTFALSLSHSFFSTSILCAYCYCSVMFYCLVKMKKKVK